MNLDHSDNNGILLVIGVITGLFGMTLKEVDLLFGIFLKFVSIISFFIIVVINLPTFIKVIKSLWK